MREKGVESRLERSRIVVGIGHEIICFAPRNGGVCETRVGRRVGADIRNFSAHILRGFHNNQTFASQRPCPLPILLDIVFPTRMKHEDATDILSGEAVEAEV